MSLTGLRFSRPVYEGLPWIYVASGAAALAVSYFLSSPVASLLTGLAGFAAIVGGVVVMLRRRDFRELSERYGKPGALPEQDER